MEKFEFPQGSSVEAEQELTKKIEEQSEILESNMEEVMVLAKNSPEATKDVMSSYDYYKLKALSTALDSVLFLVTSTASIYLGADIIKSSLEKGQQLSSDLALVGEASVLMGLISGAMFIISAISAKNKNEKAEWAGNDIDQNTEKNKTSITIGKVLRNWAVEGSHSA